MRMFSQSVMFFLSCWALVSVILAQSPPTELAPAQPATKDGKAPIRYKPFYGKPQIAMYSWEGDRVVLLTTTPDLDVATMSALLKRLDTGWAVCTDLVGRSPYPGQQHNGKVIIAAMPDAGRFASRVIGSPGVAGLEVGQFYGPEGDYERFRSSPEKFPVDYFLSMASNFYIFNDRMDLLSSGLAIALQHACIEETSQMPSDVEAHQRLVQFEEAFAKSNATFSDAFAPFGATKPFTLKDLDGKRFESSDIGNLFASSFLRLRRDHGGNDWARKFFQHLYDCPPSSLRDPQGADGQLLNWVISSSLAAGQDLSPLFRSRWRLPIAPAIWQALGGVNWQQPGLTAKEVFDAIPVENLPPRLAMKLPTFLTPERRKQSLLVGGSFEDRGSPWKLVSWRNNKLGGSIQGDVFKDDHRAAAIITTVADDIHFDQVVSIKPGTRYLLSGWIKTKDVAIDKGQQYGRAGANLSIWGGYEHTRSIVGSSDWSYVTLIFDSQDRSEITVCARLGYWFSIATGEAWFDDLNLIPIGDAPITRNADPNAPIRKVGEEAISLKGHTSQIESLAFSPDGKHLASVSRDGTVRVWDFKGGRESFVIQARAECVAFGPDGKWLATASSINSDSSVTIYNAINGRPIRSLKGDGHGAYRVMFSPDGKRIASVSGDGVVRVWNTANGQETLKFNAHSGLAQGVAFSPDGKRLATAGSGNTVKVWDAFNGKVVSTLDTENLIMEGVAYSPDGGLLAAPSPNGRVKVWDAKTAQPKFTMAPGGSIVDVTFSPNGQWLVSGGYNRMARIWDAATGRHLFTFEHGSPVRAVAVSPDGKHLATGGLDAAVKLWDVPEKLAR